jgi:transposase InsO family protein
VWSELVVLVSRVLQIQVFAEHHAARKGLLIGEVFTTSTEAKILVEQWRKEYNQIRLHSALRYRPPAPEAIMPVIMPMGLT